MKFRWGRAPPEDDSRSESQDNAPRPNPVPSSTPTWAERIESVDMSQPQNTVNAPAAGGTVMNFTFNSSDRDNTRTMNARHDAFMRHFHSGSDQASERFQDITRSSRADHETYSNQLLTKKRGYPLWVPGPGMQLPIEYRREGISIGDVGIITSTGEFDFLFNIFHPSDHAINGGIAPQGFSPLPRQGLERDIQRTTVYSPGTYLASSSVRKISANWISETSIDQRFESTAEEAAILVMPGGATTQNLLNTWALRYTISKKAEDWYTYARFTRGRDIRSGDIRVVIGMDKVSSWGIATSACNTGQTASYVFKHDPTHSYKWDCIGGSGRVGPQKTETRDLLESEGDPVPQNQCIFVRTINFSLSGRMWNDFPSEAVQLPDPGSGGFYGRGPAPPSKRGGSKGGYGNQGSGGTSSGHQPSSMPGNQLVNFDPVKLGANHPSTALHDFLHEVFPDTDMVITEDMNWISVLNDDDVIFPVPEVLCERILEVHELENYEGILRLVRNDDSAFTKVVERRWGYLDETLNPKIALRATYDDQGKVPCDVDTRVEILTEITNWLNDGSQNFFWLTGDPGCGKSAIAASLARYCKDKNVLWAQFFINQNDEATTDPRVYFPSIARQMAEHSSNPIVSETVYRTLQANPTLLDTISYYQAVRLFVEVVQVACDVKKSKPVVVIIDGLDGTSQKNLEDTATTFSSLFPELQRPNAKVFISSRSNNEITKAFSFPIHLKYKHVKHVHLDTSDPSSMEDVSRYLSRRIGKLGEDFNVELWREREGFERLCLRSGGLFIWVATVMKGFEEELRWYGPQRLIDLLDAINMKDMADVKNMYQTILSGAYSWNQNAWNHDMFRSVVGAIITLKHPLPIGEIGALLDLPHPSTSTSDPCDILHFITSLRTVLVAGTGEITNDTFPQPHKSFVEFITTSATREFLIDCDVMNTEIALKCLQLVWNLKDGDDRSRISAPSVRYAMHNWTRHLPNEGTASGLAIFGDYEAFSRIQTSATALRKSFMSASGDYRTHMYDPQEGFPPPAPFHFNHTSTIEVGDWVDSLAISMDGRLIAAGLPSGDVLLWDSKTHALVGGPIRAHSRKAKSVCFSPDSRRLVSGSWDRSIRVWDCQTGQGVGSPLLGHTSVIFSVCTDGRYIISGSGDTTIRIWNLTSGEQIGSPINAGGQVYAVALSTDGRIAAGVDNAVSIWDVKTQRRLALMEGHTSTVWTVAFSPNNSRIASGSWDKTSRLWDAQTYRKIHVTSQTDRVYSVAFAPDGQHFASGGEDRNIHVWHCNTDQYTIPPLKGHTKGVLSTTFSPDGHQFLSGSRDGTIRIWSKSIENEWPKLPEQITTILLTPTAPSTHDISLEGNPCVVSACYSPNRTLYAASTRDGRVSLWNIAHDLLWESDTPIPPIHLLRLSASQLIISSPDGSTWTWDIVDGQPTQQTPITSGPQLDQTDQISQSTPLVRWIPFKVDAGLWAYVDGTFIRFENVGGGSVTFIDVGDTVQLSLSLLHFTIAAVSHIRA